ncbi:MAG: fumarylacetoacetate hydrolase family protein [Bacteroidota bacterium]
MKTITIKNTRNSIPVGKILCLGRNYAEHAKEMNAAIPTTPIIFMKPGSSLIHDGEEILKPRISNNLHHEVELVVAIGRDGKNISEIEAPSYILGYGVGLDMTLRDIQNQAKDKGLPWFVSKGFDTSAPISEIISVNDIPNYLGLEISCTVNGTIRQKVTVDKMLISVPKIISYISTIVAIERGDLIYTGTPEGVGPLNDGDIIEASLTGYTKITHKVRFCN